MMDSDVSKASVADVAMAVMQLQLQVVSRRAAEAMWSIVEHGSSKHFLENRDICM